MYVYLITLHTLYPIELLQTKNIFQLNMAASVVAQGIGLLPVFTSLLVIIYYYVYSNMLLPCA